MIKISTGDGRNQAGRFAFCLKQVVRQRSGGEIAMKKYIGIGGSLLFDEGGMFPGYARAYVNNDYISAVLMAGGIPVIIPMNTDEEVIAAQLAKVDGLILSGGYDVNPHLFKEEPHRLLGMTLDDRDTFDAFLIKYAVQTKKPILAICRGIQILNVVYGGTLYQDCSLAEKSYVKHWQGNQPTHRTHTVQIEKNTVLYDVFGGQTLVNSFHHMALKDIAPGFKVTARAGDGIIEAFEKTEGSFALGVQFHPEMLYRDEDMLKLFKLLIEKS